MALLRTPLLLLPTKLKALLSAFLLYSTIQRIKNLFHSKRFVSIRLVRLRLMNLIFPKKNASILTISSIITMIRRRGVTKVIGFDMPIQGRIHSAKKLFITMMKRLNYFLKNIISFLSPKLMNGLSDMSGTAIPCLFVMPKITKLIRCVMTQKVVFRNIQTAIECIK